MAIHSFYVVAWTSGQPIYSRTWVEVADHPALLSGLLASLEMLALKITSQHVNVVTMKNSRFFFEIDEDHGLLFVLITDLAEDNSRLPTYLDLLNKRFLETFDDHPYQLPIFQHYPQRAKVFDELVDSLVSNWETGEETLKAATVMDLLDLYTHFYNVILQDVLLERARKMYIDDIQNIFQRHTANDFALRKIKVDSHGIVSFDKVNPNRVNEEALVDTLQILLKELIAIARRTRRRENYEALFFEHFAPLIKREQERLKEYDLTNRLVMELL